MPARWSRTRSFSTTATSAAARRCAGRFSTRMCVSRRIRHIGYDLEHDRRFHHVTESGIVVVEGNRSAVEVATVMV